MSNKEAKQENKKWFVNEDGDITDGECLIAETDYLTRDGHKNARLLAAAPELLVALEQMVYLADDSGKWLQLQDYIDVAQAVINKARGV